MFTGHNKLISKSDGESSITAMKNAVKNASDLCLGVDSKANGEIERAIKTVLL